jgi:hypothetical protein
MDSGHYLMKLLNEKPIMNQLEKGQKVRSVYNEELTVMFQRDKYGYDLRKWALPHHQSFCY